MSNRTLLPPSEPQPPTGGDKPPSASPAEKRGYSLDLKLIGLAAVADVTIIGTSLGYAYVAASATHTAQGVIQAMMGAGLLGTLEAVRVPVALKLAAQKHMTLLKSTVASVILLGATTVSVINATPIINGIWSPRIEAVRRAEMSLAVAEADKAAHDKSEQAAERRAADAASAFKESQATRRTANAGLGGLAARHDSRTRSMKSDLADARKDVAKDREALAAAEKALADAATGAKKSADAVGLREAELREAKQSSSLHLIYAAATGEEVSGITDAQLAPLLQIAVFLPALLLGGVTTGVSLLAATPIKKTAALPARGLLHLVDAMRSEIIDSAAVKTTDEVKRLFAQEAEAEDAAKRQAADEATRKAFQKIVAADTTTKRTPAKPEPRKLAPRRSAKKADAPSPAPNGAGGDGIPLN